MYVASKDDFLSSEKCDFALSYYKKQKIIGQWNSDSADSPTRYFRMIDIPFYHLRMWLLWRLYLRKVKKDFPFLKYNYGEIVHWTSGSYKRLHTDVDYPSSKDVGSGIVDWTVVCYLNDDFRGGETIVRDKFIRPKKGGVVIFNSKKLLHGVGKVDGNRYTLISWWKEIKK